MYEHMQLIAPLQARRMGYAPPLSATAVECVCQYAWAQAVVISDHSGCHPVEMSSPATESSAKQSLTPVAYVALAAKSAMLEQGSQTRGGRS
ncbi:hypothetical protein [Paraburkholderia terricola]|uniref:hypothetical protein n=1 Tax=Paraburkholderia terricola TaxID=169427 RepID=UPI0012601691|nr:hypothetical protein [Paraburkholderia terricola]